MSSHHIVREDQEPALVIADAEGATHVIQELLEWSPFVIVMEQTLEKMLLTGIKVDVVIGAHKNREKLYALVRDQAPVKVVTVNEGAGSMETAILFLTAGKYKGATFIGVHPHALSVSPITFSTVCVHKGIRWSLIPGGKFEKWLPAKSAVHILAADPSQSPAEKSEKRMATDGWFRIAEKFPVWIGEPTVSGE